jgi:CRP-like cAMP-binding protein
LLTLGRRSAIERLASFLLDVGERTGDPVEDGLVVDLPMSRADIADFLGLTIETVSRNLTKLRLSGVIDLPQPTKVVIPDISRLQDVAEGDGE